MCIGARVFFMFRAKAQGTKARPFHVATRIRKMKLHYALLIAALAVAVAQDELAWHERAKKAAEDASKAVKDANDKASQAFVESGAKAKLNETARQAQKEAQRNWALLVEASNETARQAQQEAQRNWALLMEASNETARQAQQEAQRNWALLMEASNETARQAQQEAQRNWALLKVASNETARQAQQEAQRKWAFLTEVSDKVAANAEHAVERRMLELQQQAFNFFKLSDEMIKTLEEMAWNLLQIAILLLATRYFSADLMLLIVGIVLLSGSGLITYFLRFVWFLLWLAAMAPQIFLLFLFVALFVRSRTRGVLMRACGIDDDALSKVSGAMSDACLDAWKLATSKTPFIRLEDSGDNWKDAALDPAMAARLDKIDNKIEAMIDALAKRERVAVNMGVQGAATGTGGGNGVTHILQGA
jgi:chemotaxis protein histidine kinase CheA